MKEWQRGFGAADEIRWEGMVELLGVAGEGSDG